jgi:hypothetical protein
VGKQHGTKRRTTHPGIAPVDADFLLNLIAYNRIRIPKLFAAQPPQPHQTSPEDDIPLRRAAVNKPYPQRSARGAPFAFRCMLLLVIALFLVRRFH